MAETEAARPVRVGALAPSARDDAAEVLARAFRDNPLNVAVLGPDPERRLRANRAAMRELMPLALRHGAVLAAPAQGRCAGVLLGAPPFTYPFPPPSLPALLQSWLRQGFRVRRRWGRVFHHLDALHPREPHWYVAALGVQPSAQGRGLGHALIRALTARADADGVFSYLETDRAENVAFYERAGFRLEGESACLGVRLWHLRRAAAPA
jgi:ribosomal protein S18 acetylase RimI-like enzyme